MPMPIGAPACASGTNALDMPVAGEVAVAKEYRAGKEFLNCPLSEAGVRSEDELNGNEGGTANPNPNDDDDE